MRSRNIFLKLLLCSIFVFIISTSVYVSSTYALGEIFPEGKWFLEEGDPIKSTINTTELEKTSDFIYNALFGIAVMVAIIVAMVLGIQFMLASADEKAKVKEAMMPFVVGCFVVFGSFTIWKVAVNSGNDAEDLIEPSIRISVDVSEYYNDDKKRISKWEEGLKLIDNDTLKNCSVEELLKYYYAGYKTGNNGIPLMGNSKEILKNKYNVDISSVEYYANQELIYVPIF